MYAADSLDVCTERTDSMEEASTLANKVGIIAKRMLGMSSNLEHAAARLF